MSKLEQLRQKIDELDRKLVEMLNTRAKVVEAIGELKRTEKGAPGPRLCARGA